MNGLINVSITTIERRFDLKSSQFAPVASGYDFASFCVLIPLTYFGGRATASKPRWIGYGVLLMAIGSLLFALPHFLAGTYRAISGGDLNVCQTSDAATTNGNSTVVGSSFNHFITNYGLNELLSIRLIYFIKKLLKFLPYYLVHFL